MRIMIKESRNFTAIDNQNIKIIIIIKMHAEIKKFMKTVFNESKESCQYEPA